MIEKADASWDDSNSEGGLNHEMAFVERVRDIYAFTLAQAIEKYRSDLGEQQEISSNLADILIQLFAMESAVQRTNKMISQTGETTAINAIHMTRAFVSEAFEQIALYAKEVLCVVHSGETCIERLSILSSMSRTCRLIRSR